MSKSQRPTPPPRLYGILATEAPVVLIFRRGPSDWFHLLRWRLDQGTIEPGVWVRKKLFPRRCDLSSNGEFLLYYLSGGFESRYRVFGGIARVPWLHPLASWDELDTWGRGSCFVIEGITHTWGERSVIDSTIGPIVIQRNDVISFVQERRRGWIEAPDCPPRGPKDIWDEERSVILQKRHPSNGCVLRLIGGLYESEGGTDGKAPRFELDLASGERIPIHGAAWAEWDHAGRLLVATTQGHITVREPTAGFPVLEDHDLAGLTPAPSPPPEWASSAPAGAGP